MKKFMIIAVIAILVLGGVGVWYYQAQTGSRISFRFEEVTKGHLQATVSSTGTLEARDVVDVGAQVLGKIIYIGKDPNTHSGYIDWGSEVHGPILDKDGKVVTPGTELAQIDPLLYEAQRDSAQAGVKSAEAAVKSGEAAVKSGEADGNVKRSAVFQTTRDWARAETLIKTGGIQQAEHDQAKAAYDAARASLEVSKANLEAARANLEAAKYQVVATKSNLRNAQTNLDYSKIEAPVDGIVIDRRVNVGQTVVASLSAPSLFLIAKEISKLEVWATVNEVDVGRIKDGQDVNYTVDAHPGYQYKGKVVRQGRLPYRLNATMNSNVVTYTVVVSVDNKDGMLKPYMTTNLQFVVEDKKDAVKAPNAALRWQPSREQIAPDQRDSYFQLKNMKRTAVDADALDLGFIWTQEADGYAHYTQVKTGATDGAFTEILSPDLADHTQVIVGEGKTAGQGKSDGSNPFTIEFRKRKEKDQ